MLFYTTLEIYIMIDHVFSMEGRGPYKHQN